MALFEGVVALFEHTYAPVELVVRELDHCLRVGEAVLHPLFDHGGLAVHLFVHARDRLGKPVEPFVEVLDGQFDLAPTLTREPLRRLAEVAARLLPQRLEQELQLVIGHRFILLRPVTSVAEGRRNGRVSRLLLLLQCYHLGLDVGRYVSIEWIIEQNKERYYETLEESSRGWHDGANDPWPYVNYLLYILKEAYREFEARVGEVGGRRGEKREVILAAIDRASGEFSVAELQRECPGVSVDMIRHVLKSLRDSSTVECLGRGRSARWRRKRKLGNNS